MSDASKALGWAPISASLRMVLGLLACTGVFFGVSVSAALAVSQPVVDSEGASAVGPLSATLEAQVNPEEQETMCVRFEYAEASTYENTGTYDKSVPCANASLGSEATEQRASATVTGLERSTEYDFRVVVENASSPPGGTDGSDQTFTTRAQLVEGQSFSSAGPQGVTLSARINVYGVPTTYHFLYGPTLAYGSSTPAETLTAGEQVNATAELIGLTPSTEYHFRIVVESQSGVTEEGPDMAFKTLPPSVHGLPDDRVFEMVTPPENYNADVYIPEAMNYTILPNSEGIITGLPFQIADSGESVAYIAESTVGGNGANGEGRGNQDLASRRPEGGWEQTIVQPPGGNGTTRYQAFSSNLSAGFLLAGYSTLPEAPTLSPEAPAGGYEVLYSRSTGEGSFQPLFTKTSVAEFGQGLGSGPNPVYAGSSADLGESLFEDADTLTSNAVYGGGRNLYDSVAGRLSLVNVLPDGVAEPNATFGGFEEGEHQKPDFSHVISADGSRIFWTDLNDGNLYVRENPTQPQSPLGSQDACIVAADACTVQVDREAGGEGRFWAASSDGSKVFFTKGALYEYNVESGHTTDLSEGATVEGVVGTSADGSYVYFVEEGDGLYVEHNGERPKYVATLSANDLEFVGPYTNGNCGECGPHVGDAVPNLGRRTAEVTPSGGGLVFMSRENLTGYQAHGLDEVFVYDAEGSGHLFCASCNPSGEPPQSQGIPQAERGEAAAYLPISFSNTYIPKWMSDDGSRVFFDSVEPLVAQDTNGKQDVYEWERDGTGSCQEQAGCIYLLSGGVSGYGSWLLGGSSSGEDVFFVTRAQLASQDQNENDDLYDAKVGGVQPVSPPACTGSGCQGVPSPPPTFATPPSVTFNGVGNFPAPSTKATGKSKPKTVTRAQKLQAALKACDRDHQKRKRASCESTAKRHYGAKKAKRSTRRKTVKSSKGRS
jgi:hypothetical protein